MQTCIQLAEPDPAGTVQVVMLAKAWLFTLLYFFGGPPGPIELSTVPLNGTSASWT